MNKLSIIPKFLLAIVWSCSVFQQVYAQYQIHSPLFSQNSSGRNFTSTLLAGQNIELFHVSINGGAFLHSNAFPAPTFLRSNNFIGEAEKATIFEGLDPSNNRMQQGASLGLSASLKLKGQTFFLSYKNLNGFHLRVDSSAAKLLLNGNADYAGKTLESQELEFFSMNHSQLSLGTVFEKGNFAWLTRLNFYMGNAINTTQDVTFNLFTAPEGSQIDVQAAYNSFRTRNAGIDGLGVGIDLGMQYAPTEWWEIQAIVSDLGFISWEGERRKASVDFSYSGLDWSFLSENNSLVISDSLENLLYPNSEDDKQVFATPGQFYLAANHKLNERSMLTFSIQGGLSDFLPAKSFPRLNVAYGNQTGGIFSYGANVYLGGIEGFGIGGFAKTDFQLSRGELQLYVGSGNLNGFLFGNGVSLFGGLGFRY